MNIHLLWDDCAVSIAPLLPELERELTYREKSFKAPDPNKPWERRTVYTNETVLRPLPNVSPEHRSATTYQGLWLHIKTFLEQQGHTVYLHDNRLPFPKPKLDVMGGFRFRQKQLLETALQADCSGLIGAPTRYGKTFLIINTLKAYPDVVTIVAAPGKDLVKQLYDDIRHALPQRDVVMLGGGGKAKYQNDDITVASIDSLHKCEPGKTRLILIDEPHTAVTDNRLPVVHEFHKARRLGFGATLDERYDNRGILVKGLFGPVLSERTFAEAVKEGAVAPLRVFMLEVGLDMLNYGDHSRAYKLLLYENEKIAKLVARISHEILPEDWQAIMFIKNEAQAEHYKHHIGEAGTIAMAKKMTSKEREVMTQAMKSNEIKRCLATDIYATGVTFNHVRAVFNLSGGGPYASTIQKPGRVVEVRDGKRCGVLFDFNFIPKAGEEHKNKQSSAWDLVRESKQRLDCYTRKGYDVQIVKTFSELSELFKELCL